MAVIDRVKWDANPNSPASLLAWRFPSDELSTLTQLIVNESQEAFLVRGGVYEGPFRAGRHTLSTENLPVLRKLIALPFGGQTPFSAEVWFVNKASNLDVRWGTPDPIQLEDPKYKVMVPVSAFGQYGIRISDSKKFLLKIVGVLPRFDADSIREYFRGAFITRIKTEIANAIVRNGQSVLEISTQLETLSNMLRASLADGVAEYGVELSQFNIMSINVPERDPAVVTLKAALAKRAEMGIIGFTYQQERSFDVMQTAAGNEGTAGSVASAGIGMGVGLNVGAQVAQAFGQVAGQVQPGPAASPPESKASAAPATSPSDRIRLLRELAALKADGILSDSEFEKEKQKILSD